MLIIVLILGSISCHHFSSGNPDNFLPSSTFPSPIADICIFLVKVAGNMDIHLSQKEIYTLTLLVNPWSGIVDTCANRLSGTILRN
jgi:hypothetical protein